MITLKGNYSGTIEKDFEIKPAGSDTINPDEIGVEGEDEGIVYDGSSKTPGLTIIGANGAVLVEGTDYDVEYINNTNAGTAAAVITFKGNYDGTLEKAFSIKPLSILDKLAQALLEYDSAYYDGAAKSPAVIISGLTNGVEYTVTYENNVETGAAVITITATSNYDGSVVKTFSIVPRPVLLAKATSKKKSTTATIKWKAVAGADRYVIYIKMGKGKLKVYKTVSAKKLKLVLRKLKKNRKYTFVIKAQKNTGKGYETICKSVKGRFVIGKTKKNTNPKKLRMNKKKVKIKAGKSKKIKGKQIKQKGGKFLIKKLRFVSANPSIATVSKKGKIKGKRAGKCSIYAIGANGVWKKIKVTVK